MHLFVSCKCSLLREFISLHLVWCYLFHPYVFTKRWKASWAVVSWYSLSGVICSTRMSSPYGGRHPGPQSLDIPCLVLFVPPVCLHHTVEGILGRSLFVFLVWCYLFHPYVFTIRWKASWAVVSWYSLSGVICSTRMSSPYGGRHPGPQSLGIPCLVLFVPPVCLHHPLEGILGRSLFVFFVWVLV